VSSDRGSETTTADTAAAAQGTGTSQQLILSRLSNNSWLGDDEDEDDPFAMLDPGWDEMDLEANIARDRHARLAERVEQLVRSMKITDGEEMVGELAEDLVRSSRLLVCCFLPAALKSMGGGGCPGVFLC
jgi:hypothetical protein